MLSESRSRQAIGRLAAAEPAEIPDVASPADSALAYWHLGERDAPNPAHAPFIPPLANVIPSGVCDPHPRLPGVPDSIRQVLGFLEPGGQAESFCAGLCGGDSVDEIPIDVPLFGVCDPLG